VGSVIWNPGGFMFSVNAQHFKGKGQFAGLSVTALILGFLINVLNVLILTQCSRVLIEKVTGFQLVKKFSAFYGT
jgi:hypothetical protein